MELGPEWPVDGGRRVTALLVTGHVERWRDELRFRRVVRRRRLAATDNIRAQIGCRFTLEEAVNTLASIESGTIRHSGKQSWSFRREDAGVGRVLIEA